MVAPVVAGIGAVIAEIALTAAEILVRALIAKGVRAVLDGENKVTVSLSSSAITEASYDPDQSLMTITFKQGNAYDFQGAEQEVFEGLVTSSSPGTFYNEHIKGRYGGGSSIKGLTHGLTSHWTRK